MISNPCQYHVSLYSLKVDGQEYHDVSLIPPKGQLHLPFKKASEVSWQAINDYGGIVPAVHRQL